MSHTCRYHWGLELIRFLATLNITLGDIFCPKFKFLTVHSYLTDLQKETKMICDIVINQITIMFSLQQNSRRTIIYKWRKWIGTVVNLAKRGSPTKIPLRAL